MPRFVALEWDNAEARVVVARVRTGQVDLDHAYSVPLVPSDARAPADLGAKISDSLKKLGITNADAIVAVGRASIELRFLTVPPVPPEELPDLVRFQASRQFSQPIEEGLLDYAPLTSSGDPPASVLAAAITPELLKTIHEVCQAAHLSPKHLVLRPFAADSLVTDRLKPDSCVLTVDRLAEEVDLTVVLSGQAVFPRSVRVGNYGTAEEQASTIVGEMKRTIAAAQNQIAGRPVESVLILGRESEQQALAVTITRELSLPVEFVDPLESVTLAPSLRDAMPSNVGRFAPLVGALLDESRGRRHEIDFLAPRKRPQPRDRSRLYATVGAVSAALALFVCGFVYWQLSDLEAEAKRLQTEANNLDKAIKGSKARVDQAAQIDEYAAGQIAWLDELRELATDLPPGDKVILDDLTASLAGGAKIVIRGGAAAQSDVPELESKLRDDRHRTRGLGTDEVPEDAPYSWSFTETIELVPGEEPRASTPPPAAPPRPPSNKTSSTGRKS